MKKLIATVAAIAISGVIAVGSAFAIDINNSSAMELDNSDLMRVGPAIAKRIVDERTMNGPFKDATDLRMRVSGIGARFLEQNADKLEFGPTEATTPATTPTATVPAPTAPAVPATK